MKNARIANSVFALFMLMGLFLPHDRAIFQVIHAVSPLLLYILYYKKVNAINLHLINLSIVAVMVLSLILNVLGGNKIEFKDISRLISLILLFALFPFVSKVSISNTILYFSALYIFISQIAYVVNLGFLVRFFDTIYPYSGDVRGFSTEFLLQSSNDIEMITNRRYGGLFHNPNQAVRFMTLLLGVFYIENKNSKFLSIIPFILIATFSIILSGSRTGLIVGGVLTAAYFLFLKKQKLKIAGAAYFSGIIILIFFLISNIFGGSSLRLFDVEGGLDDSLGTKFVWFFEFFAQLESPFKYIFGHFTSSNITESYGIPLLDSEWGELFYNFGILGFIVFVFFYAKLWRTNDNNIRFFMILLLWGITSTVIFSFRMSFLFMLFLSKYYSEYKIKEKLVVNKLALKKLLLKIQSAK